MIGSLSYGGAVTREKRRLAAIVAADVVGYSRLMERDESGTLARLKEIRRAHLEPVLLRNGGRLVKLTGDGALVEFGSAVEALNLIQAAGAKVIRIVCIVAAPEGIAVVEQHHPNVSIYTPVVDQGLNEHKYIVPGLGDFGDRLYGTM